MPLFRLASRLSVQCANWLLTQMYQQDVIAFDTSEKLPSWAAPYLYPEARLKFPSIEPTTLVAIINTVQAKYRASRFDLWRNNVSLPVYRDMPLPINAQVWKLEHRENDWVFSLRVGGEWHEMVLRGGAQFYRQHRALAQIVSGEIEAGEAALYEHGKSVMLKIPGWFPRGDAETASRTIKARTCTDGFLIAVDGNSTWRLNADHVQRWIAGSDAQQQRLREDLKAERRFPKAMREGIVARMGQVSDRRNNQLSSWMHESSMQLVNWAKRRKASQLIWDDSYPSMLPQFPWYTFAARVEQKCEIVGIEFIRASEGATQETGQPLAETESSAK